MREFEVVDLSAQCQVQKRARYQYDLLERIDGAADLIGSCSAKLWHSPETCEFSLPQTNGRLKLRWRACAANAGIATLHDDVRTLSISLLASGLNPDDDHQTIHAFQRHIVRALHDTGFEPSFELREIEQRPLLATMGLFTPSSQRDHWIFAIADRCFAAAYFRKIGLA